MWQRIQTLYLAIGFGLLIGMFWLNAASVVAEGQVYGITFGEKPVYKAWLIILAVFQGLALGGYKWRMKQFSVVLFTTFACLGFQGYLVYDYIKMLDVVYFKWTALLPLVIAFLDALAARAIMVDEVTVQSTRRLRSLRKK